MMPGRLTRMDGFWNGRSWNLGSSLAIFLLLLCTIHIPHRRGYGVEAMEVEGKGEVGGGGGGSPSAEIKKTEEEHVPQVRYRSRPVAPFRSGGSNSSSNSTGNSSSEADENNPSGMPFFTVHDLSSQTFERLQENWRNLEVFLRNLQARRSQDESQRSQAAAGGGVPLSPGSDGRRRPPPPYSSNNNMFTFKYHPVVLEGEGSSSSNVDDIIGGGGNTRITTRHYGGGNHFSPFPLDHDPAGKNTDMEKHTVATIYTIGICLTIMAIGSVMFILINKCDGTGGGGGNSYTRTIPATTTSGSRGVLAAAAAARAAAAAAGGNRPQGRTRSSRRVGATRTGSDLSSNLTSANNTVFEQDAKIMGDLPPSYDSLFPEEEDPSNNLQEVVETRPCAGSSSSSGDIIITANPKSSSSNENERSEASHVTSNENVTSTAAAASSP